MHKQGSYQGAEEVKITNFDDDHGSHLVVDSGNGSDWRMKVVHNGFDGVFYFIDSRNLILE